MSSQATLLPDPEHRGQLHERHPFPTFVQECRQTLTLALPLIAGQVGQMLMGIADTVMLGRVGVLELGASTFANTLTSIPYVLGIGLLTSVSVLVSNARGAERPEDAQDVLRHGTWLALGYGFLVVLLFAGALPFLQFLGQPPDVTERAHSYLLIVTVSLLPALMSVAWKNHADALNQPWTPFWILTGGVLLNVGLNWVLIWGHWGFPALGLEGAAIATLIARTAVAAGVLFWLVRSPATREWSPTRWLARCRVKVFADLLRIGFPASLHLLTEVGAFAAAALLVGTLGKVALAAHQVALTCAATAFMVPLGVSMAMTVRIGELAGAGERARMHRVIIGGWLYAVAFMSLSALGFLLAGKWVAQQFVGDVDVVALAAQLLVIAGIFQLVDGLQVVSVGALRGVGDVRVPAWLPTSH
ncbi:MAG: MATE family efflux transporter [Verrucomicrobiaceae bacterium]|nr:MAG: MATE family efflux transporter [Verrucomicrobiaceae bacterium]